MAKLYFTIRYERWQEAHWLNQTTIIEQWHA